MTVAPKSRPGMVTALGVIYLVGGALMVLAALLFMANNLLLRSIGPGQFPPGNLPISGMLAFMLRYWWQLGLAQGVVGGVLLLVAIAFLRLRPWSRAALEGVTWLWVVYAILFTALFLGDSGRMMGAAPAGPPFPPILSGALAVAATAPWLAMAGVAIYFLRSRAVREAMRP